MYKSILTALALSPLALSAQAAGLPLAPSATAKAPAVLSAPALAPTLVSGDDHEGHDHVMLGELELYGGFSRATLPNAPVGGGFLTITNHGAEDRLIAVETPVAAMAEIHEMAMEGDVMRMRELADGLVIPAGETIELKPGSYHLMFMKLTQSLVEGETVEVTLTFEHAGTVTLPLMIGAPNAKAHDHGAHDHGTMNH